jgi:hypothetical protein
MEKVRRLVLLSPHAISYHESDYIRKDERGTYGISIGPTTFSS